MLRFLAVLFATTLVLALVGVGGVFYALWHYGRDLPDYRQLAEYKPKVMSRVHGADGRLIVEFAKERRLFVPISAIPKHVIQAFLSAEDKTFYRHFGLDPAGIARAMLVNVKNLGSGRRPKGASTITQQVAKNFLLTNEVSYERKIKEAILAVRMEHAFEKDRILELYLNEIFLGRRSYGVAAAALNYFDKSLDELTLSEAAYLAALPKAPNNYHPFRQPEAALARRNWVLNRMTQDGILTPELAAAAKALPLGAKRPDLVAGLGAAYFAEEVRRQLVDAYGEAALYEGGMSIRTTLVTRLQVLAERVLRKGLRTYDRRHGWRGPLSRLELDEGWAGKLAAIAPPPTLGEWRMAVVLKVDRKGAGIGFGDASEGRIPLSALKWARPWREGQKRGPSVKKPADVLSVGDVVAVSPLAPDDKGHVPNGYRLEQIPDVDGAIVALDPHTGRVLAMVGGYDFKNSQYNRATQAMRQPGSAFKPFVYAAALDHGFTPASIILDGPFVIDQGPGLPKWKPSNYSEKFYGPSTLRLGLEKSRNLMTVRLAQEIGMDVIVDYARRFGIVDDMPAYLPMALGAGETTLLRLSTAYAMLVNGGKRIQPTLIDRIQDRRGQTIFRHDRRRCESCAAVDWEGQPEPLLQDEREQILDPGTAYQVVSLLRGVVLRGTGRRVAAVGKPLAGKTGTTNESRDTWFMGFAPDLVVGVFVGFDDPKPLGRRETGSSVSAPIFRDFMAEALANEPDIPFRIPSGIKLVRVDSKSGLRTTPGARGSILEAFKPGTEPSAERPGVGPGAPVQAVGATPRAGTGGLY
ncbi:MAG: penicillin-binding protein 1A [Alphaproteobacteria bacterium]|nr:penicillin-binding protein 1A [Alphaproteobacteria bacterium]